MLEICDAVHFYAMENNPVDGVHLFDYGAGHDCFLWPKERLIRGRNLDFCIAHVISKGDMPVTLGHMNEHDVELTFARTRNILKQNDSWPAWISATAKVELDWQHQIGMNPAPVRHRVPVSGVNIPAGDPVDAVNLDWGVHWARKFGRQIARGNVRYFRIWFDFLA
jgi:hypothetical protein